MPKRKIILFLCLLSAMGAMAQDDAPNGIYRAGMRLGGRFVTGISADTNLVSATDQQLVTAKAVRAYVAHHSGSGGGGAVSSVNGQIGDVVLAIPEAISELTNDAGYITSVPAQSWFSIIDKPTIITLTQLTDSLAKKVDISFRDTTNLDFGFDYDSANKKLILQQNTAGNINAQTGTSYTLDSTDIGKVITFSNSSAITLTIPPGLRIGFNCTIIQIGTGQVTFSESETAIYNSDSYTKTLKQYSVVRINSYAANTFVTDGQMQ